MSTETRISRAIANLHAFALERFSQLPSNAWPIEVVVFLSRRAAGSTNETPVTVAAFLGQVLGYQQSAAKEAPAFLPATALEAVAAAIAEATGVADQTLTSAQLSTMFADFFKERLELQPRTAWTLELLDYADPGGAPGDGSSGGESLVVIPLDSMPPVMIAFANETAITIDPALYPIIGCIIKWL